MSVFEKVTDVGLEIPTDTEIDKMIEELKNEKQRRYSLNKINAIDEILKVIDKNANFLDSALFTLRNGSAFYIDDFVVALEQAIEIAYEWLAEREPDIYVDEDEEVE